MFSDTSPMKDVQTPHQTQTKLLPSPILLHIPPSCMFFTYSMIYIRNSNHQTNSNTEISYNQ